MTTTKKTGPLMTMPVVGDTVLDDGDGDDENVADDFVACFPVGIQAEC